MKAAFVLLAGAALASAQTVYFIRHGEKPSNDSDPNLSAQGLQRAQCLRTVFGASSQYDIGYIIAEKPKGKCRSVQHHWLFCEMALKLTQSNSDDSRLRPLDTVTPLAQDLGLTVDTSCGKTKSDCVADLVNNYTGAGNILICWEHGELTNIADAIGINPAPTYPDGSFNLIWTSPAPHTSVTSITSENCPGLDS
ncbi:hypothetical protein GGI43DRAFT_398627 [Trichoderma evansii]